MKKVSIIIVNWNGLDHLKKCLPSLTKIDYPNYEVILVDNASVDDSLKYVKKNFPKIKIVLNKKNEGFSGGNNRGLGKVTGEYILLLNNDTVVTKNFLTKLVDAIEKDKRAGVIQSKILSMDYPDRLDSVGAFYTNTGFLYHYGYFQKDKKKYDKEIDLYTGKGACLLIRKEVIDKVGLFDEDFFAYFEETDFCHRVWLAGYSVRYCPDSVIYHKVGGTSNSMNNAFIQYHSFKNRINSYIKNLGIRELIIVLPMHLILVELASLGFIFKRKVGVFFAIQQAVLWNIKNLKTTLKKRKIVKTKIRKVRDQEFLPRLKRNPGVKYYYYLFAKSLVGYKE